MTTFTLTNKLAGDAATELGTIAKGGTLKTAVLPKSIREAIAAGHLEISPALVSKTVVASPLDNEISASADAQNDIVDVTATPTQTLVNANDATLAKNLAQTQNDLAAVRSELDALRQQFA